MQEQSAANVFFFSLEDFWGTIPPIMYRVTLEIYIHSLNKSADVCVCVKPDRRRRPPPVRDTVMSASFLPREAACAHRLLWVTRVFLGFLRYEKC